MSMIEDLQRTVVDLSFEILVPSLTTSHARNFTPKGSPILGQATIENGQPEAISSLGDGMSITTGLCSDIAIQSLSKVETSGKNKTGASIDPYEHLQWAIEALKGKGLNKQQVFVVVAKIVDDTFVAQVRSTLNPEISHGKGCLTKNTPFSSISTPIRDLQTQATPAKPFVNPVKIGNRIFNLLYMTLPKALQILIGQGHLKTLDPRRLPDPLPAKHNAAKFYAFHQQTGHDTDGCFRLCHEVQDLINNKFITPPGPTKSIGTRLMDWGDNVTL
ncbi:hypothetical protein CsSME_00019585 [Camellia sinensis var. sinensis]